MLDVPRHRGEGWQGECARRRGQEAVGRRHPAVDRRSGGDDQEVQLDQEAAHDCEVQQAARGRSRRARRLHAKSEVALVISDRASLRHPVTLAGVVITTVSAVAFLTLLAADMFGMFANPYAGLVIFIAVPALFVFGLLLIPLGIWLQRRALRRNPSASVDWP